ncbi:MAG: hypothetical protein ACREVN_00660 [Gammaproteobacteria bacterium]
MLNVAVVIFAIGALLGVSLALHVLRGKFAPWALSLIHALVGATGLVLLVFAALRGTGGSLVVWSLAAFLVAALGGFYLASLHFGERLPAKGVVVAHASLAVAGFALLLVAVLGG